MSSPQTLLMALGLYSNDRRVEMTTCLPIRYTYNMNLTLNDYQKAALKTTRGHDEHNELFHLVLGLTGETGEVAEKFKKLVRDKDSDIKQLDLNDMSKELGDVLWYLAVLADFLGISLEDIAQTNLTKLADRQKRGLLNGSGDNR